MDYKRARIPRRFWEMTLDDYKVNKSNAMAAGAVRDYIESLKEHRDFGTGLTFCGPPGTGKTLLACLIGKAAVDAGYTVMYMPLAEYIRIQLVVMKEANEQHYDFSKLQPLVIKARNRTHFLLLDDVGKEHVTESRYAEDEFDYLVRHRYDRGLPTIMTSNLPPHAWGTKTVSGQPVDRYGEAMESFLYEAAPPVEVDAADYRRQVYS